MAISARPKSDGKYCYLREGCGQKVLLAFEFRRGFLVGEELSSKRRDCGMSCLEFGGELVSLFVRKHSENGSPIGTIPKLQSCVTFRNNFPAYNYNKADNMEGASEKDWRL